MYILYTTVTWPHPPTTLCLLKHSIKDIWYYHSLPHFIDKASTLSCLLVHIDNFTQFLSSQNKIIEDIKYQILFKHGLFNRRIGIHSLLPLRIPQTRLGLYSWWTLYRLVWGDWDIMNVAAMYEQCCRLHHVVYKLRQGVL